MTTPFWWTLWRVVCRLSRFTTDGAMKALCKVFHAARQDLEIFFRDAGVIPSPV